MSVIYWIHLHTKSEVRKTPTRLLLRVQLHVSRLAGSDTKIAGNYIQVTAENVFKNGITFHSKLTS